MVFETVMEVDNWMKEHRKKCKPHSTAGEQFQWTFIPTGIVECQTIECLCCGKRFTSYID